MKKLYTEPSIRRHRLKLEYCIAGPSQYKKLPATGVKRYINEMDIEGLSPSVIPGDYVTSEHTEVNKPFIEGD